MIEVRGLTKAFGPRRALQGIDLDVARGEFLTLLGPNGAGKTTLLRILASLTKPTSGSVRIDGLEARRNPQSLKQRVGFVSHQPLLYDALTPFENLVFYGRLYAVRDGARRADALLDQLGLADRRGDAAGTLSRGLQQRLAIARALLHDPPVLLLDEPYTGLDPEAAGAFGAMLEALKREGRTIVLTTHDLERGLQTADRVAILVNGRLVYEEAGARLDLAGLADIYRREAGATA